MSKRYGDYTEKKYKNLWNDDEDETSPPVPKRTEQEAKPKGKRIIPTYPAPGKSN